MQSYRINPRIVYTYARVARVSLADCFALGAKGTGGLNPPGYSKTVLRTENVAAAPNPYYWSRNGADRRSPAHVNLHVIYMRMQGSPGSVLQTVVPLGARASGV